MDILYKENRAEFKEDIEKLLRSPNLQEFFESMRKIKHEYKKKNRR